MKGQSFYRQQNLWSYFNNLFVSISMLGLLFRPSDMTRGKGPPNSYFVFFYLWSTCSPHLEICVPGHLSLMNSNMNVAKRITCTFSPRFNYLCTFMRIEVKYII